MRPTVPLRALLTAALGLALLACQSLPMGRAAADTPTSTTLQRVLASGQLRVGLTGKQPPLNMTNKRGEIVGLEVDLVQALARSMGLEATLVTKPFAELLPALERGEVDLVISGMTITPERNARVAFAGPYFISGKSVLTRSARIANVDSSKALDDPSRTYAALAGSTSAQFVKEVLPHAKLRTTEDYDQAVQLVIDDQVDALVADYPICVLSVLRNPTAGLSTLVTPFTIEPLGIALPAGDPLFVNLLENYLNTLEGTGLLTQLKAKWFSDGAWLSDLP
jgi:polar amino acid transport system substrate-binding protein